MQIGWSKTIRRCSNGSCSSRAARRAPATPPKGKGGRQVLPFERAQPQAVTDQGAVPWYWTAFEEKPRCGHDV
jgi:hypothetical protein